MKDRRPRPKKPNHLAEVGAEWTPEWIYARFLCQPPLLEYLVDRAAIDGDDDEEATVLALPQRPDASSVAEHAEGAVSRLRPAPGASPPGFEHKEIEVPDFEDDVAKVWWRVRGSTAVGHADEGTDTISRRGRSYYWTDGEGDFEAEYIGDFDTVEEAQQAHIAQLEEARMECGVGSGPNDPSPSRRLPSRPCL